MPLFKVSDNLEKYAREVLRTPFTIITNCPQCRSTSYADGTCEDCSYEDPRYLATLQAWQEAQMAQQQGSQKKSSFKLSFNDYDFPDLKTTSVPCPRCNQTTFEIPDTGKKIKKQDYYRKGGECTNPKCNFSKPPQGLGFNSAEFVGIDPEWLQQVGGIRQNFKPIKTNISEVIEKNKKSLKKSAKGQMLDPGAFLDDSMTVSLDKTTRMKNMLQQSAQLESQTKQQQQNDGNADSEEQQ